MGRRVTAYSCQLLNNATERTDMSNSQEEALLAHNFRVQSMGRLHCSGPE